MKKLKIKLIFLSISITAVLLFGGWFAFQFFGLEKPIQDWVEDQEGIELVQLTVDQQVVDMEVQFHDQEEFGLTYLELITFLELTAANQEIQIRISPEQSVNHPWWLNHSPAIMEMIAQEQYTGIKDILEEWQDQNQIENSAVTMNDDYIFIYIHPVQEEGEIYLVFAYNEEKGGESHG